MHSTAAPSHSANEPAHDVRERLLDVSERLFAEQGFRAASVRTITLEAECNLAAVNYYFQSKQNLYREVVARRLRALREQRIASIRHSLERAGEAASLELLLRSFATAFVEPLVEESTGRLWMQLLSREMVDPHLPSEMFLAEMILPVNRALAEALMAVCPGLERAEAELCTQSLVAQLIHCVHLQRFTIEASAPGIAERFALPRLVEHALRFSSAAIQAFAAGRRAPVSKEIS